MKKQLRGKKMKSNCYLPYRKQEFAYISESLLVVRNIVVSVLLNAN